MSIRAIQVKGACQNNLKNLDLNIPLNKITVVTGVSGSGKSSLAFDTLYAEGQRRYVETFSPYARQFMDRMDRPHVEAIQGIPPAIAIDRKDPVRTSRSTVGTMTEVTDYVKLVFARMGQLHCRKCGKPVVPETPELIWQRLKKAAEGSELVITYPISLDRLSPKEIRRSLAGNGFHRIFLNDHILDLEALEIDTYPLELDVVVDRVLLRPRDRSRILDSLEQAYRFGNGRLDIWMRSGRRLSFSNRLACAECNIDYNPPLPNLFSFNSPIGACDTCRGFGRTIDIDIDLIIPNPSLSIAEGAIKPWGTGDDRRHEYRDLVRFCRKNRIKLDTPFKNLPVSQRKAIIEGTPSYYGIRGFFNWLETKTYKMHVRVFLSRYRSYNICHACSGTRFKPETLLYRINGLNIGDIYSRNVLSALNFFEGLSIPTVD